MNNHIIPELGHIQLQKLTAEQIQAFYAKMLREGLSPNTIRLIHTILRTALKDAVKWKRIPINMCDAVSPPRSQRHEILPLYQDQVHRLLEAAKGNRLEALLTLALTTGMRLGEILALHWINIDFEKKTLQVLHTVDFISGFGHVEGTPKTESSRCSITLPHVTIESLKQHRTYQLEARLKAGTKWKEQGLVFPIDMEDTSAAISCIQYSRSF